MKSLFTFLTVLGPLSALASSPARADNGVIRVEGTAGVGQDTSFLANQCLADSNGQPQRFGCGQDLLNGSFSGNFNQDLSVPAGLYEVTDFTQSGHVFVNVPSGGRAVIQLQKVTLPAGIKASQFWIFKDLTDSAMLNSELQETFSDNNQLVQINQQGYCTKESLATHPADQPACKAVLNSPSAQGLFGPYAKIDSNGALYFWNFELSQFVLPNMNAPCVALRCFADPTVNAFAAVLPGVFGITYQDQNGNWQYQRGIHSQ